MGLRIANNGKVNFTGETSVPLRIDVAGSRLEVKTFVTEQEVTALTQAIGTTILPDGAILLAASCEVIRTIASTTITAAVLDDSTSTLVSLTADIATNTLPLGVKGDQKKGATLNLHWYGGGPTAIRLVLTGTGTPAGRIRVNLIYAILSA